MTTPPEQLQAKPVLRIKAAETRVSAFLPHKNPVNSLIPTPYPWKDWFFFLIFLEQYHYIGPDLCHTSKNLNSSCVNSDIARGKAAAWWNHKTHLWRDYGWFLEVRFNNTSADRWGKPRFKCWVGKRISNFVPLCWHEQTLPSDKGEADKASSAVDKDTHVGNGSFPKLPD